MVFFCPSRILSDRVVGVLPDPLKEFLKCRGPMLNAAFDEDQRCDLCHATILAIEEDHPDWTKSKEETKWIGLDADGRPTLYHGQRSTNAGHFDIPHGGQVSPLDRSAALNKAKNWLDRCVEQDADCTSAQTGSLPARLLRLNDEGSSRIQLVNVKEGIPYKFACLSYRWGVRKEDIVRTTIDNLEQHLQSIELASLPQTIVDAVEVCRELHIPYLWVDSLCIIQARNDMELEDDEPAKKDWKDEGSKMQDAYWNSWLTIYAEDAERCTAGFLGDCKFGTATHKSDFDYYASEDSDHEVSEPMGNEGSVLSFRGWCLQEDLLSNRRLRFYKAEMVWECNHFYACQCTHMDGRTPKDDFSIIRKEANNTEPSNYDVLQWHKIVENYSWRELFEPESNKLMAIAAAANIIARERNQQYLQGLWRSTILDGLAWATLVDQSRSRYTPLQNSTPRWSWASINGPVMFTGRPFEPYKRFYGMKKYHQTTFIESGPGDSLILQGPLLRIQLAISPNKDDQLRGEALARPEGSNGTWQARLDFHDVGGVFHGVTAQSQACWKRGTCECQPFEHDVFPKWFFALHIHTWKGKDKISSKHQTYRNGRPTKPPPANPEFGFLILQGTEETGTYKRIGFGYYTGSKEETTWNSAENSQVTLK